MVCPFKMSFSESMLTTQGTSIGTSNPNPPWSKEAILGLVAIFVTLILFVLGIVSRHRLRRWISSCFRRAPASHMDSEGMHAPIHATLIGSQLTIL
jgi:hypothetical protein